MKVKAPFILVRRKAGLKLMAHFVQMVYFKEIDAVGQIGKQVVWLEKPIPMTRIRSLGYVVYRDGTPGLAAKNKNKNKNKW